MRAVSDYLNLLANEHQNKPKFEATVTLLTAPMVALQAFLADLPRAFDLDYAIGAQLDIDGIWIGRSRQIEVPLTNVFFSFDTISLGFNQGVWFGPFTASEGMVSFDDTSYRALLRAKIICNEWDGTVVQMQTALQQILSPYPDTVIGVVDNYNMTMDIGLAGAYPPSLIFYLVTGGYVPFKPEGVALNVYVTSIEGWPLFGLDVETNFISGLDVGALGVTPSEVSQLPAVAQSSVAKLAAQAHGNAIATMVMTVTGTAQGQCNIQINANVLKTGFIYAAADLTGTGTASANTIQTAIINPTLAGVGAATAKAIWIPSDAYGVFVPIYVEGTGTARTIAKLTAQPGLVGFGNATTNTVVSSNQIVVPITGDITVSSNALHTPIGTITTSGTTQSSIIAGIRQRTTATLSGAGTSQFSATVLVGHALAQGTVAIHGIGTASYVVTESLTGTVVAQPGQILLASQTPGSAAPTNGPIDSWEINSAGLIVHNGTIDTSTSGVIALLYSNHSVYQVSTGTNSFGTPGWWLWNGSNCSTYYSCIV